MPSRSKIDTLPEEVRRWLDAALSDAGFGKFELLSDLLKGKGHEISKSAIGRYSKGMAKKLAAISASTHAAKLIAEQAKDDGNALGGAVMTMVNQQLFDIMVSLQELDLDGLDSDDPQDAKAAQAVAEGRAMVLAKISKALAELNRALQGQKKFYQDAQAKADAHLKKAEQGSESAVAGLTPQQAYKAALDLARGAYGLN